MRLKRLQRFALFVLGAAVLGGGVAGAIVDVGGLGVLGLILPGLMLIVFVLVGVFPNVNFKEGSIDWAKVEPVNGYLAKDEFEQERKAVLAADTQMAAALREEIATVSTRLEDFILANSPAPDDGLTDEVRLDEMREGYQDLDQDVSWRDYEGEVYNDGQYTEDLRKARDSARDQLRREERRQLAQYTFGMRTKPPSDWG